MTETKPSTGWLYLILLLVALVAVGSQVTYTIDAVHALRGDYTAVPFALGDPWPTIRSTGDNAARAGLKPGDLVTAIDGRPVRGMKDLAAPLRDRHPGDTLEVAVERDRQAARYRVPLAALAGLPRWYYAAVAWFLMPWLAILLGLWVALVRPRDLRAWLMLGVLLGLSQLSRDGSFDALRWVHPWGVILEVYRVAAIPVWAVAMMLFGVYFPKRWDLDRRFPWVKWVLIAAVLAPLSLDVLQAAVEAVNAPLAAGLPHDLLSGSAIFLLMAPLISTFFTGLAVKYHEPGLAVDDRRRLRLLYWGCTAAMLPIFLLFLYDVFIRRRSPSDDDGWVLSAAMMVLVLFPLSMAYAVVVQRALDVRMVIRQGVQYTLARRGIKVLQAVVVVAVVSFAALQDAGVSRPQRFIIIALGVLAAVRIRDVGERLRRWVDRRFFREAYKAEQVLEELSLEVRGILERQALLETVTRKISSSLHVERIAVMLREGSAFRPVFAAGYPVAPTASIPLDDAAVEALSRSREPVPVAAGGAIDGLDAQFLLPLASRKELLGFISLGPKKSEEPYSASDASLLRTVAVQTGLALENSLLSEAIAAEVAERELLNREIEIAREVQQRLFPQNLPQVASLEYAGHCRPARGVGGDYYDFLALAGGQLGLVIADVSGKGVPAALLMASLQASVRGQSQAAVGSVAEVMVNVNRLICDASHEYRYATFFYARFNPANRVMLYSNGGHNPPMLLRGGQLLRLEKGGPPVGLFGFARYEQEEIRLEPGDLLVLYTDGISEAENCAEAEWGEDALLATARTSMSLPPAETIARIMREADAFAGGAPQHDDMTLVIARVL